MPVYFWLQEIFCPSDNENNTSTSTGISGIHGTIWSMCFISKDMSQPNKDDYPVLAVLLNRYDTALHSHVNLLSGWSNRIYIQWVFGFVFWN